MIEIDLRINIIVSDAPWANTRPVGKYFGYLPGIYPL